MSRSLSNSFSKSDKSELRSDEGFETFTRLMRVIERDIAVDDVMI
jgi:hypothetical protein